MAEHFAIILRPEPPADGEAPADVRLRALLKLALRGFKLRCIECRAVHTREPNPTTEESPKP